MKNISNRKKIKIFISLVLIILSTGSLLWFIYSFKYLSRAGELRIEHRFRDKTTFVNKRMAIDNIKPWMTFSYLNVIFKLDPIYLKNALNITNSNYPNIRIDQYARRNNINPIYYVENIKGLIINYPTNN